MKKNDNGIIVLIEDYADIGQNTKYELTKKGYEVIWIKDIGDLNKFIIRLQNWDKEHLELIHAIIFDFYLDERCEHWTLDTIPKFIEYAPLSGWILLANSPFDDLNELLVQKGCTHSRPSNIKKKNISQYLLQILDA